MTVTPIDYNAYPSAWGAGTEMTGMGPDIDWIMGTLERRRQERHRVIENMRLVKDTYNGDLVIPLPELSRQERPAVANLIVTGIDQTSQRIASVMPQVDFPPLKPGVEKSMALARTRTMACQHWWKHNRMQTKMRRRARWLVAYGSAPVVIRPHFETGMPMWHVRDPLSSYPAPVIDPDDITPPDAIFTYFKSYSDLRLMYPQQMARLCRTVDVPGSTMFELVEYVDADCTVLAVLGQKQWGDQWAESMANTGGPYMELERVPNRTGICPAVVPQRITLDRPRGQFDDAVGMYSAQARLFAMEMIAVEKGVFPDTYLVGRANETPQFISGPHDGRTGLINVVKGGDVREISMNPAFAATNMGDRLERNSRVTSGVPSEYGGESPTNVRTGKRGDAVMAAITSFPVQEAQETFAAALEEENRRAVAVARTYFGRRRTSFPVNFGGAKRAVDYIPNDVFETDANTVTYAMAGADQNALIVGIGQRVGMGLMSKRTAQELDPLVADPELEQDRVVGEGLRDALMASLQQQAQAGAIPPADMARIAQLVFKEGVDLFAAVDQVQKEAQERQASAGPVGAPDGPAPLGAPETMPGLAQPGMGAEVPAVGPPPGALGNVSDFLQMLR